MKTSDYKKFRIIANIEINVNKHAYDFDMHTLKCKSKGS